jgi:CRP/FNR family transcriptional regulator
MYSHAAAYAARSATVSLPIPTEQAPTLKDLFKGQVRETFDRGEALFWEGDEAGPIFEVLEGVVRVYRTLPDGRRGILGFVYPGDVLGVSFQSRYLVTAEAVNKVKTRRFPRERFFATISDSPVLQPQLFAMLCDEMSAAQDQMLLLGRQSAEERVVCFLLAIHSKSARGAEIQLPMGRQDMADYLGLTMETVSRMMTSLARRGLVAPGPRHTLTLRKLANLREIAGRGEEEPEMQVSRTHRAVWPN